MDAKDFLLGSTSMNSNVAEAGRLLLRVTIGLALALAHGLGKLPPSEGFLGMVSRMGFPAPLLFAWLATLAEVGGGLLLAVGLLTRPAALLIVGEFVVIYFIAQAGQDFVGREKELLFLVGALFFLLAGAGRFSIDALLTNRKKAGPAVSDPSADRD